MRPGRRALRLAAAAGTLAAAGPALAEGFDWSANLGAGYTRTDSTTRDPSGSGGLNYPTWEAVGNLQLNWTPFRPGLLFLSGAADYRHYQQYGDVGDGKSDGLTYMGSAALFSEGPLTLELGADRGRTEFSTDLGARQTGSTITEGERVGLLLGARDLPRIQARYTRSFTDNENYGGFRSTSSVDLLSVAASQAFAAFDFHALYDTSWSRGTFADSNYRSHRLDFQTSARPLEGVELRLSDAWLQRKPDPDRTDPSNPLYDSNVFNAGASWRASRALLLTGAYGDTRFAIARPTQERLDRHTQILSENLQYDLTRQWTLLQGLASSRTDDTLGPQSIRTYNHFLSGGARWVLGNGESRYSVEGQGRVGLAQTDFGAAFPGGGGLVDLQYAYGGFARRAEAGYRFDYSRNLEGQGWVLNHELHGTYAVIAGPGLRADLRLDATQRIFDSVLIGKSESRLLRLRASASYLRVLLQAAGGVSEGAIESIPGASPPTGAALPDRLQSRNVFAQGQADVSFWRTGLAARATTNWLRSFAPGRPHADEVALSGLLMYTVGLFTISLEDRYSIGTVAESQTTANYFFVRATRSFGSR